METRNIWTEIKTYFPLLEELVSRDLKVKYRRSVLGYCWSLLNPLMMMGILTMVFGYMFRRDVPNYPLYIICGNTLWSFLNESTNQAMYSVSGNSSLIKKVYIPKYIFPISKVVSRFVTMLFSLVAILITILITRTPLHWTILLFPIPLAMLLLFCCGVGLILSSMSVYFRDVVHLYSVVTLAWMYGTPIFYPLSAVPENVRMIIQLNPMYHYITFFRDLVLYGQFPGRGTVLSCIFSTVVCLVIGVLVFHKLQRNFILHI